MTQADFKLESISERSVEVTHIAEGHWYRFKINKGASCIIWEAGDFSDSCAAN